MTVRGTVFLLMVALATPGAADMPPDMAEIRRFAPIVWPAQNVPAYPMLPRPFAFDGIDNNCDGLIDLEDPAEVEREVPIEEMARLLTEARFRAAVDPKKREEWDCTPGAWRAFGRAWMPDVGAPDTPGPAKEPVWWFGPQPIAIFGADMTLPPSWSLCIDIGRRHAGKVSGTMNMAGNLGSFVTGLAFPYLRQWTGSTTPFFLVGAGLNVLAILAWAVTRPEVAVDASGQAPADTTRPVAADSEQAYTDGTIAVDMDPLSLHLPHPRHGGGGDRGAASVAQSRSAVLKSRVLRRQVLGDEEDGAGRGSRADEVASGA